MSKYSKQISCGLVLSSALIAVIAQAIISVPLNAQALAKGIGPVLPVKAITAEAVLQESAGEAFATHFQKTQSIACMQSKTFN